MKNACSQLKKILTFFGLSNFLGLWDNMVLQLEGLNVGLYNDVHSVGIETITSSHYLF